MASTIQGYEYDIFISYRKKDNKYDGWVMELERLSQKPIVTLMIPIAIGTLVSLCGKI